MTSIEVAMALIGAVVVPVLIGVVKHIYGRLSDLDQRLRTSVSEEEVRRLINDKIEPLREDIHEIKTNIDKLLSYFINK